MHSLAFLVAMFGVLALFKRGSSPAVSGTEDEMHDLIAGDEAPDLVSIAGDGFRADVWLEPSMGGVDAICGITWDNGHYSEVSGCSVDEVGFLGDLFKAAGSVVGPIVKAAKRGITGEAAARNRRLRREKRAAAAPPGKPAASVAKAAAKGKLLNVASATLKNPTVKKALKAAGVNTAAVDRAAHTMSGVKNAAAALASKKKGDTAAARQYTLAADADASAARAASSAIKSAAKQVYYLTLSQ